MISYAIKVQLTQVESHVKIIDFYFQNLKEHIKKTRNPKGSKGSLGSKVVWLFQGRVAKFVKKRPKTRQK